MGLFDSQSLPLTMVLLTEICQRELAVAMKTPLGIIKVRYSNCTDACTGSYMQSMFYTKLEFKWRHFNLKTAWLQVYCGQRIQDVMHLG